MPFKGTEEAAADPYNQKNYGLHNPYLATMCTVYFTTHIYFSVISRTKSN